MIRIEISAAAYLALARGLLELHRSPQSGIYLWLHKVTLVG